MSLSKVESLPTEMKIGDRVYEIINFLQKGETSVTGHIMMKRAEEMSAHLGEDDGQYLLDHQGDIPEMFRGKVQFVFTNWRRFDQSDNIYYIFWHKYNDCWEILWACINEEKAGGGDRFLRRKS